MQYDHKIADKGFGTVIQEANDAFPYLFFFCLYVIFHSFTGLMCQTLCTLVHVSAVYSVICLFFSYLFFM